MINQDMLTSAKSLLEKPWDGSQTNKQAREIAQARINHYCDMLVQFAQKNPTTILAANLLKRAESLRIR